MYALTAIQSAYRRLNRLSPGETLGDDEADTGLAFLNELVDEMSGAQSFLFQNVLTSASVTGTITLGAGSWAAVAPGCDIISAVHVSSGGNVPLSPLDARQYNEQIALPATAGEPNLYYYNGLATVTLFPVPTAQTIQLHTRTGVAEFADLNTTDYTLPPGYKSLLAAELAVRLAPSVLGKLPPDLVRARNASRNLIPGYKPAVVDAYSFASPSGRSSILRGY